VLCPTVSTLDTAEQIAARFLETMRQPLDGVTSTPVGASIGVLLVAPASRPAGADQVVERADMLMYQAKRAGGWGQRSATFRQPDPP
jgi:GGDEF domain-containing protein